MLRLQHGNWIPRFKLARRRMREIAVWRSLPADEIRARQLARINAVWAAARESCPYYRQLAARNGLPEAFASLDEFARRLPVLERDTLRDATRELLSPKQEPGFWAQTGGSTGTPTSVYKDRLAHGWSLATQYFHRQRLGVDIFSPIGMLWGHSVSFAPGLGGWIKRVLLPMEDRLRNRLRLSAYNLTPGSLENYLKRLQRFKPPLLYGYASALYLLADVAERTREYWPELRAIVSTSEVMPDVLRDRIATAFGVTPCDEYGAMECGIMATSLPGQALEIEEHNVFLETVPNAQGSFDILVTSLWNQTMPLLRYRLGDCCERRSDPVPQGYRTLGRVLGRTNDNLVGGDGRIVHSEAVPHILKHYALSIRRFTAVQAADGAVTVHVEPIAGQTVPVADLERRFSDLLRRPVTVALDARLPAASAAGKHRWVVSHFKPPAKTPLSAHDRAANS